ncbi:MAG: choice-of-anchor J domain-containing protein [Parafilimonas sp.]
MKKNFILRTLQTLFAIIIMLLAGNKAIAQLSSLTENFDNVVPAGWVAINHSTGNGTGQNWFQGDVRQFVAYSGTTTSYAAANYQSVGGVTGQGTISNWLLSPLLNLQNGSTITFYTRTVSGSLFPDRLEVRLSKNGASTDVGSGTEATGDFSTLLLSINPSLDAGGYPDTGWTQYTVSLSGISGTSSGRVALRYYVTEAGSNANNSNYIGIDEFSYENVLPVTLLNFNGTIQDNKALLTWSTANELNNKGFDIELSHDNKNFSSIGFVAGHGTAPGISQYNFTDNKLLSGSNYYRLKQVDVDGNFKYSSVIKLDLLKFDWKIFGNAAGNNSWIQLQTEADNYVAIQIISANGQVIQTINKGNLSAGTYNIPLNLQNNSHGIYIVRLSVDKHIYSKKLIR